MDRKRRKEEEKLYVVSTKVVVQKK